MDLSMIPTDNIYNDIKGRIKWILFKNSPVYQSIQDDIDEIIDWYNQNFKKIKEETIQNFPIKKEEKDLMNKIQGIKINGISLSLDTIKINRNDKDELKKMQNSFEKLVDFFWTMNPEIKESFDKFKIKAEAFWKIFREEILNYKKGANRALLMKEKDRVMKSIKVLITKISDIFIKENTIKINKDNTMKPMMETVDNIFTDIVDRICVKK